jgi:hypothetical protein
MMSSFAASSSIIAVKTYTAARTKQKKLEHPEPPPNYDGPNI